jgi:peptide deformylase
MVRTKEDPILRKISKPVKEINGRIIELLDDMRETMEELEGIGLAAPQVGVLRRVVIIRLTPESELYELINPVVIESRGEQVFIEGCLSVPGERGFVARPEYAKVEALNRNGEKFVLEGTERLAVAIFHEIDHLNGILYTDKLTDPPEDAETENSRESKEEQKKTGKKTEEETGEESKQNVKEDAI